MNRRLTSVRAALFSAGTLLLAAAAAGGVELPARPTADLLAANPDSALAATLSRFPGEPLTLRDALDQAASQATEARIAAARLAAAGQVVRREKGLFDPELFGAANWSGADTPSASLFAGADVLQTENTTAEAGARLRLPLGTELTASVNSQRLASNSAFAALDPEYQAFGALSVRQPLLKGFGPSARRDLNIAEQSFAAAGARHTAAALAVRTEVESVYWTLYAAERNHGVASLIRDRANAFLNDTRLRAKAGLVGPSHVASAEFFLTETEQAVLDTEEQLDRASDRLASLTGRRPHARRYRAADEPPREFLVADQDSLVEVVMLHNPELQALAHDVDAVKAAARGATWDARPTLDLVGSLGGNGLSGSAQDVYFPGNPTAVRTSIDGGRGDSLDDVFRRSYPTWNVGFVFALPLGSREGRGERGRAEAEVVRAEQQLLSAQRILEEEVRAQHRELERGRQRLSIAGRGVAASTRQVDIGLLEYRNGRATAFEVVRLAADLATAQQRYSDALVRTARAAAVLRQLTGGHYSATSPDANPARQEN